MRSDLTPAPALRLARSSARAVWASLTPWQRECVAGWVENGPNVNEEIRHSFGATANLSSYNDSIHEAMQAASRMVVPGQVVWRGSAWPQGLTAWMSDEYVCCSAEREIAARFVDTPAWPWPDRLEAGGLPATPATARVTIGRGVRAVALTDLLELSDSPWYARSNCEREIVLLPCRLTVTAIDEDGTVQVLAGRPIAQVRAAA